MTGRSSTKRTSVQSPDSYWLSTGPKWTRGSGTLPRLDRGAYARWIDRGRPQPSHREWADYLEWAADRVGLRTVTGEVQRAELVDGGWALNVDSAAWSDYGARLRTRGLGPGSDHWCRVHRR